MNQTAFGDRIGIDRVSVARIESGTQPEAMDYETAVKVSEVTGIPLSELKPAIAPQPRWYAEYLESLWHKTVGTTGPELEWLRGLSLSFWCGAPPTPEDVAKMIMWRRERCRKNGS